MESINQYGRTPAEIASIIAGMNPNIVDAHESSISAVESQRLKMIKWRMNNAMYHLEDSCIRSGEYVLKGLNLTPVPK